MVDKTRHGKISTLKALQECMQCSMERHRREDGTGVKRIQAEADIHLYSKAGRTGYSSGQEYGGEY